MLRGLCLCVLFLQSWAFTWPSLGVPARSGLRARSRGSSVQMLSGDEILVLGSTGRVGSEVVRSLKARGIEPCCYARSRSKAEAIGQTNVIEGDFENVDALHKAMEGRRRIFLACGNVQKQLEYEENVIKAATKAKVDLLCKLSTAKPVVVAGGGSSAGGVHAAVEQKLEESGLAFTSLRAMYFIQNLLRDGVVVGPNYTPDSILKDGRMTSYFASKRMSIIDLRDVAESAAAIMLEPDSSKHKGMYYDLTGPSSVSFSDVAEMLSRTLQRPITCESIEVEDAIDTYADGAKIPREAMRGLKDFLTSLATECDYTTDDVLNLSGKPARPVSVFVEEYFTGK